MITAMTDFALNCGLVRRLARSNFPAEFARPTIEERLVRAFRLGR